MEGLGRDEPEGEAPETKAFYRDADRPLVPPGWVQNFVVHPTSDEVLLGFAILAAGLLLSAWAHRDTRRVGRSRRRWIATLVGHALLRLGLTGIGLFTAQILLFLLALVLYAAARPNRKESLN